MKRTKRRKRVATLRLPDEYLALCEKNGIPPETVLRGFVADLAGIMSWAANPWWNRLG